MEFDRSGAAQESLALQNTCKVDMVATSCAAALVLRDSAIASLDVSTLVPAWPTLVDDCTDS